MQKRVKQDLLQGMLEYPAPVYSMSANRVKANKFFQSIQPPKVEMRLSRRNLTGSSERQLHWDLLRKSKNI